MWVRSLYVVILLLAAVVIALVLDKSGRAESVRGIRK